MGKLGTVFVLVAGALVFTLLVGCGGGGPAYAPVSVPADQAIVYIYRPKSFVGSAVSYFVKVNGVDVTKLKNGGYFPYVTPPGTVVFSAKTEAWSEAAIDVAAGGIYFIKGSVTTGAFVGRPNLQQVHPSIAQSEIMRCRLLPPAR
jgi:hypothetical protein